jgi:type IV pilus assembly protein PilW
MTRRNCQRGFGLVELMIATTLGLFLIGGAIAIHLNGSATYRVNEAIARVQETANVAMDIVVEDLRRAGYWAQTKETAAIIGRANDPLTALNAALEPGNDCYAGYWINIDRRVETAGDAQTGAANPLRGCIGDAIRQPGTDILVVRHAAADTITFAAVQNGRLYLVSNFLGGALFVGGQPLPSGYSAADAIHEVETYAYYVNRASSGAPTEPSLRRMRLSAGPTLSDEELVSGIEDMQVQLGVDSDADGAVDQYVSAGAAGIDPDQVVAARIWLRARSDNAEVGFTDDATYQYADVSIRPNDSLRRLLVSETVQMRNARQAL